MSVTTLAPEIKINGLSQGYGKAVVLDGVTCQIPAGGVVGLLGPNGAGKTTLLKTLATILKPRSGSLEMFDR